MDYKSPDKDGIFKVTWMGDPFFCFEGMKVVFLLLTGRRILY